MANGCLGQLFHAIHREAKLFVDLADANLANHPLADFQRIPRILQQLVVDEQLVLA